MWERGARHNPASFRYRFYMDHRPILPQDPTLGFWRKSYNQYENIYFPFKVSSKKSKYIFSNNLPVNDREDLKTITEYHNLFAKNFKYFAGLAALYLSGFVFNQVSYGQKHHMRLLTVIGAFALTNIMIKINYLSYFSDITSYYFYKYQHLAVDSIQEVKDKRRNFFTLDTSVYYRETAQDIRHAGHHPASEGHHDHDTSSYYGPYPVKNFINFYLILNYIFNIKLNFFDKFF
jgi:hypothetical protein